MAEDNLDPGESGTTMPDFYDVLEIEHMASGMLGSNLLGHIGVLKAEVGRLSFKLPLTGILALSLWIMTDRLGTRVYT